MSSNNIHSRVCLRCGENFLTTKKYGKICPSCSKSSNPTSKYAPVKSLCEICEKKKGRKMPNISNFLFSGLTLCDECRIEELAEIEKDKEKWAKLDEEGEDDEMEV